MSVVEVTSGASVIPEGKWSVDLPRSSVTFAVKHMMLATVKGRFREFDGMLEIGTRAPRAAGTVKAASVDTKEPVRDEHLRSSPDFFDVECYPEIGFDSTRIDHLGGGRFRILGDLTIRNVTCEIELNGTRRRADGGTRVPSGSRSMLP